MHLMDLLQTLAEESAAVQYGPYILAAIGVLIGLLAWIGRRIIARQDQLGSQMAGFDHRLTIVETKQDYTVGVAAATQKTTNAAARTLGVDENDIEQTIDLTRYSERKGEAE